MSKGLKDAFLDVDVPNPGCNVLFTLNHTTLKCLYEYLNKKSRYRDLIYFILKLLA